MPGLTLLVPPWQPLLYICVLGCSRAGSSPDADVPGAWCWDLSLDQCHAFAKGISGGGLATCLIPPSNPPLPQFWGSLLPLKSAFVNHYSLVLVGLWRCQEHLKVVIIWRLHYGLFSKLWKHCFSFPSLKLSGFLRTSWHLKIKLMHICLPANALCIQFFTAGTYLCMHERSMCVKSVCAPTRVTC